MDKPPKVSNVSMGIDWGADESTAVYTVRDSKGNLLHLSEDQYQTLLWLHEEKHRAHEERSKRSTDPVSQALWSRELLIDFMVGTTTGEDKKNWLKAQRYLRLGRKIQLKWGPNRSL